MDMLNMRSGIVINTRKRRPSTSKVSKIKQVGIHDTKSFLVQGCFKVIMPCTY